MANWWEDAPLVEDTKTPPPTNSTNWWEDAPLVDEPVVHTNPTTEDVRGFMDEGPVPYPEMYGGVPSGYEDQEGYHPAKITPEKEDIHSLGMYDENTPQEAYERYNQIGDREGASTGMFGETIVDNKVVPAPAISSDDPNTASAGSNIVQMTTNTARGVIKNTAVTAGAMLDQILNEEGTPPDQRYNFAEKADKAIADRAKGNGLQELVMQASEFASGAIAGFKVGNKIGQIGPEGNYSPRNVTGKISKVLSSFGSMMGAAISTHPETETLVVGDNAALGGAFKGTIWEGLPVNEDMSYSEKVINRKLNMMYDELTAGLAIQKGLQVGAHAGSILKKITYDQIKPIWSEGSREAIAADRLIDAVNISDDPQVAIEAVQKAIREDMDVFINMGTENDMQLSRTLPSAINESLKDVNPMAANRAMEVEQGLTNSSHPKLQAKIDEPYEEFRRFQTDQVDRRGGVDTIQNAAETIGRAGIDPIEAANRNIPDQEQFLEGSKRALTEDVRNNPVVGETVRTQEVNPSMDVNAAKSGAEERVMKDFDTAAGTMKDKVKENYGKITEGTKIDDASFIATMKNAQEYLPTEVKNIIGDEGTVLDFRTLNNDILPKISQRISQLMHPEGNAPIDTSAIDALKAVRDNIVDTQVDFIKKNAESPADMANAKAAEKARKYFKETVQFREAKGTGKVFKNDGNEYNRADDLQSVANSISDKKKGTSRAILDFINRPEYAGNKTDVFKVYLGDVASRVAKKMHSADGIDKVNPEDFVAELGEVGVELRKEFPNEFKEIEDFTKKFRDAKGDIKVQQQLLDDAKANAKKVEEGVYGSALKRFIVKDGDKLKPTQDGYAHFKTMLNSQKESTGIDQIVKAVRDSGDEVAQKGLESAYLTYLKDRMGETAVGFSDKQVGRMADIPTLDNIVEYGKKIFKDPKDVDDYVNVVRAIQAERDKRVPQGLALSTKGEMLKDKAKAGAQIPILAEFGQLNPTATMARKAVSLLVDFSDADHKINKIIDSMVSDKDEAMKLMTKLANKYNNRFGDEAKTVLWKTLVSTGIYNRDEEETFNDRWINYVKDKATGTVKDEMKKLK